MRWTCKTLNCTDSWKKADETLRTRGLAVMPQTDGRNTKAQAAKVRPGKQDYAEPQAICLAKQSINRVKSQPAEREKTFANHAFGAHIQNRQ